MPMIVPDEALLTERARAERRAQRAREEAFTARLRAELPLQLIGRARFCRARGEIKTPQLLEEAAAAIQHLTALALCAAALRTSTISETSNAG